MGVLADGSVKLTAFIPNDASFRKLVKDLTGERYAREKAVFNALVDAAGVDTIETVLLYHVVPGAKINSAAALDADGAELTTAQGGTVEVDVISKRVPIVQLRDQDPDAIDPFLDPFALDINKGNKQIAHGILFVLRPWISEGAARGTDPSPGAGPVHWTGPAPVHRGLAHERGLWMPMTWPPAIDVLVGNALSRRSHEPWTRPTSLRAGGARLRAALRRSRRGRGRGPEDLLDVWRGAGRYDPRQRFTSWLFTIAHHRASTCCARVGTSRSTSR